MTLNGAIQQLKELRDNELMPVVLRPWFDKPIETIEQDAVEVKYGRWRNYEGILTCSVCGMEFYNDIMEYTGDEVPHYCPNCGAFMENEDE